MFKKEHLRIWACPAENLSKTQFPQKPEGSLVDLNSAGALSCLSVNSCCLLPAAASKGERRPRWRAGKQNSRCFTTTRSKKIEKPNTACQKSPP